MAPVAQVSFEQIPGSRHTQHTNICSGVQAFSSSFVVLNIGL